jgi:hypothetical protein
MDNETTRRFPRTMHEAFNCDCNPISGPYGKQPLWPLAVVALLMVVVGIFIFWSRI